MFDECSMIVSVCVYISIGIGIGIDYYTIRVVGQLIKLIFLGERAGDGELSGSRPFQLILFTI